jgi:hypothetical protein
MHIRVNNSVDLTILLFLPCTGSVFASMELRLRSLATFLPSDGFSTPENYDIMFERLYTNGLFYMVNYVLLMLAAGVIYDFVDIPKLEMFPVTMLILIFLHATLRKRSIGAKIHRLKTEH